ncbi:MAG: ParB/RepB/Spo0J family partition protein [Mailhella sp.]|nr:ParB/RepB/Spo0J family partition protein [Mailhella sp.]
MSSKEWGLGRGISSLFPATEQEKDESTTKLALTQLAASQNQPRKRFDSNALAELASSVKKQGILQPLLVRLMPGTTPQRYEIVAGERRWRAAKMAGLTEVPVIITCYTDKEAMTVALVENLQRENLNPMEEAEALKALREAHNLSQEQLAEQLGKSRSAVANSLRLLQLPANMQDAVFEGEISAGHARALLSIAEKSLQEKLYAAIQERHLSVREAEAAAENCRQKGRLPEYLEIRDDRQETQQKKKRAVKPQTVKDLQSLLRRLSGKRASISGDGMRGNITIPYASEEELEALIEMLTENKS